MQASRIPKSKRLLARAFEVTKLSHALLKAQALITRGSYIRAINYHGTPKSLADGLEEQLRFFSRHFSDVSYNDLESFFRSGKWHKKKPGLIISFDDGLRSNAEVAVPLLEKYGFTGWFFVPVAFIDSPPSEQLAFARSHQIVPDESYADGRIAMSWEELREMSKRHVVGCHTRTHRRMTAEVSDEEIEDEIVHARDDLQKKLGRKVYVYCWVGGEEHTYSARAARAIRRAGYRFAFMTNNAPITARTNPLQLQRTNIEAFFSLDVVRFQISGAMDLLYTGKRRRVNRLTA
ncbi:MAG: polysaccharide deacetylase family protein [Deltaproteobacteria bacterium]|nr:polysaccharide deacetylase family protein [Deltaproteobacteria bacterium]